MTWASSPTTTWISGAPNRPRASTSQPARSSTACRAAARQVKLAIWQPVTKPDAGVARQVEQLQEPAARPPPRRPSWPARARRSRCSGPRRWSASRRATATGSEPPTTKPKKRGPADATRPGSAARARSSSTASGACPRSGSGPPNAARSSPRLPRAPTGRRSPRLSTYSMPSSAARRSRSGVVMTGQDTSVPDKKKRPRVVRPRGRELKCREDESEIVADLVRPGAAAERAGYQQLLLGVVVAGRGWAPSAAPCRAAPRW